MIRWNIIKNVFIIMDSEIQLSNSMDPMQERDSTFAKQKWRMRKYAWHFIRVMRNPCLIWLWTRLGRRNLQFHRNGGRISQPNTHMNGRWAITCVRPWCDHYAMYRWRLFLIDCDWHYSILLIGCRSNYTMTIRIHCIFILRNLVDDELLKIFISRNQNSVLKSNKIVGSVR